MMEFMFLLEGTSLVAQWLVQDYTPKESDGGRI